MMAKTAFDLVIRNAQIVAPDPKTNTLKIDFADVGLINKKIASIGSIPSDALIDKTIDAKGLHLLPGAIDTQVHFREPGFPDKENLSSGTRAAIFGGVTTVFEMPNTSPPTLSALDIADKLSRAKGRAWCNYAFYVGASPLNVEKLSELEKIPGVCGVKMFMGSSTGNLTVGSDENMLAALKNGKRRMAVHAEDEDLLTERKSIVLNDPGKVELHPLWRNEQTAFIATEKILRYARQVRRNIHVLHITTAEEVELLSQNLDLATFEITPQHLTLSAPECYERLGTLAQMNPPVRTQEHQDALWKAVTKNLVSVIGSDHAPHTLQEKAKIYPESPSGMTGVQTLLPLMLHHSLEGRVNLDRVINLVSTNPSQIFGIKNKGSIQVGYDADLVLVDLKANQTIKNSWIQSTCGWTPFDGMKVKAWVRATLIAGQVVMRDNEVIGSPLGHPIEFAL